MSRPRLHDDGYLAFLRQKPCCCGCGHPPKSEAAHIRIGFFAMGKKPDDKFAVPLHKLCHIKQHSMNETEFWKCRGLDPFAIAARLYTEYGGDGGHPRKKRKPRATIRPKGFSRPIAKRTNAWPKGRTIPKRKSSGF